jgi:hypothetical protein
MRFQASNTFAQQSCRFGQIAVGVDGELAQVSDDPLAPQFSATAAVVPEPQLWTVQVSVT